MELYVEIPIGNRSPVTYQEYKLSLFGDEEIELTKSWGSNNLLTGYGSYSKSFAIPIDANNTTAFKNFNIIGADTIDPNYFITARIVVNSYEIRGNLQVQSFSLKNGIPYSYNVVFYGEEKDLIKLLNTSTTPKLNNIDLGYTFTWEQANITETWQTGLTYTGFPIYVPIMATKRPFCFRDNPLSENNINYAAVGTTSGVTVADLIPSFHLKTLFIDLFDTFNIDISFSTDVETLLNELYVAPNIEQLAKVSDYTTHINTITTGNTNETVGITTYAKLKFDGTIYSDNDDFTSWDNIADWTISTNEWTAPANGTFQLDLDITSDFSEFRYQPLKYTFILFDEDDNVVLNLSVDNPTERVQLSGNFVDNSNKTYRILGGYRYYLDGNNTNAWGYFWDDQLDVKVKITKVQERYYGYIQDSIKWADMYLSDFFINFCKTFNLFFIYNSELSTINVYTKDNLPSTTYDLSNYLIVNEDYTFTSQPKYKNIDYKFKDGKDTQNIIWKNAYGTNYGEYKQLFDYDLGIDNLNYTSIFTVFPHTNLNKTDDFNVILETGPLPIHQEVNESLSSIQTDFLLFYKSWYVTLDVAWYYSLQNSLTTFQQTTNISDYGPTNVNTGYELNYNVLTGIIPDNVSQKYETNLSFILPYTILYNLKVYDTIVVKGIYYEIIDMNINIKNGFVKIKCRTI